MADSYDVIVIGGGPGGYVAAIRAAQLGQSTAVVEKDKPGGRCLNYACIPAKTMLHTAELYDHALNGAELGIKVEGASLDWKALGARRAKVSDTLAGGVKMLWDKNKVEMIEGEGALTGDGNVKVGDKTYEAKAVVLATGSVAMAIPGVEFGERVVDTWGAWSLPEQPKKIAVVGAGASGAEIASAYGRFGTEVILIEMLDQILPAEDKDVARVVERAFKKQNITISTGTKVEARRGRQELGQGELRRRRGRGRLPCIAGGRAPDTEALKLADAGVETEEGGKIKVDEYQRTSNQKVYAIGDLVRREGARPQGVRGGGGGGRARRRRRDPPRRREPGRRAPPSATPRSRASASPRPQAKEAGHDVKVGRFKLGGVGAAAVYDDRDGLVKIVADSEYGEILGAHVVGNRACDMISELVDTMALEGGYQELARIVHPHPTISEAVLDAARAVDGWAIHQ